MGNGYGCLKLDKDQGKKIVDILKIAGIKSLTPSKFHVTLMYDVSNPDIEIPVPDKTYTAKITGVERLGKKGSKWEAIVFTLESKEIEQRFKELVDSGYKHSYDTFVCHMSVLYKPNDTDEDIINIVYKLGVLPEELTFGNETWSKLVD